MLRFVAQPDFKSAARRHYRDSRFLLGDKRWPNADHLAGVAAECGLKAILLGYFGATLNQRKMPIWGPSSKRLGHVDGLWGELPLIISGRAAGPVFTALVAGTPEPFAAWDVADRYSDGSGITEQQAQGHADKAEEILKILEQATITGVVP